MRTAWLRRLTPLLVLALLAGAIWLLHRELAAYHYEDVRRAMLALTRRQIEIALGLTAISYILLTGHDALGLVAAAWFGFFVHKHTEYSREVCRQPPGAGR